MSELHVRITEVAVSMLPDDDMDRWTWTVHVSWRRGDRYSVVRHSQVLNRDGEWEYEPQPSSRDDDFKARTRFDYDTAYRLACEQAPLIRANGMTAGDVLARRKATR